MSEFVEIAKLISPSALPLVVCIIAYFKIQSDRKGRAANIDNESKSLKERLAVLEERVNALDDLRSEVRQMNDTLQKLVGMFEAKFR